MANTKTNHRAKFEQLSEIVNSLEEKVDELENRDHAQLELLKSVSQGLYEEVEKLCKKAPAEAVTNLALEQMNDVIRETKQLVTADTFVQRLNEFVAAGDNPELRDALMVMRQIRQGLQRYEQHLESETRDAKEMLREALFVHVAVALHLDGKGIDKESLANYENGAPAVPHWMLRSGAHSEFDLSLFDETDLAEHFQ